ncbi:hypothetical protein, partial [Xanthomonas citri]
YSNAAPWRNAPPASSALINQTIPNDFIYKVERVQFLSSSDPTFSNELGQQIQEAQLKKKSVYKSHIPDFDGNTSRTMTVDPMYKEAAVESSCTRVTIKLSRRRFVERINSDIWA